MAATSNIRVTEAAHRELSRLAVALTAPAGRRVSMSDALLAACAVASADVPRAAAALPPAEGSHAAP